MHWLAVRLLVPLAKFLRPRGVRAVAAESLSLEHQLLICSRSRHRAPNLTHSIAWCSRREAQPAGWFGWQSARARFTHSWRSGQAWTTAKSLRPGSRHQPDLHPEGIRECGVGKAPGKHNINRVHHPVLSMHGIFALSETA